MVRKPVLLSSWTVKTLNLWLPAKIINAWAKMIQVEYWRYGGLFSCAVVTPEIHDRIMREVIYPTVNGMAAEGNVYTGFLYAGLMIMPNGQPKVIEFNCRFGDPETQPIMLRLESDLVELCLKSLRGKIG